MNKDLSEIQNQKTHTHTDPDTHAHTHIYTQTIHIMLGVGLQRGTQNSKSAWGKYNKIRWIYNINYIKI